MRPHLILSALTPILLAATAIATQLPSQAQTIYYRRVDRSDRDYSYPHGYYPHGGASYRGGASRYEIEDSTLVNPVLVEPRIQDSTLINPVIVEPGQTYPSRSYPSRSYPSRTVRQSPTSRNPSCVDFASLRMACQ